MLENDKNIGNLGLAKRSLDDSEVLNNARVAELVDALDSKSSFFGSAGSIPASSTNKSKASENISLAFLFL